MYAFGAQWHSVGSVASIPTFCVRLAQSGMIFTANVSPMKYVNQTRTNVINRLRIHQDLRAFLDSATRS
jgi:hypothetical protein